MPAGLPQARPDQLEGMVPWTCGMVPEIAPRNETMVETSTFVGIEKIRGRQNIPVFLRWCEMEFVYPQYHIMIIMWSLKVVYVLTIAVRSRKIVP